MAKTAVKSDYFGHPEAWFVTMNEDGAKVVLCQPFGLYEAPVRRRDESATQMQIRYKYAGQNYICPAPARRNHYPDIVVNAILIAAGKFDLTSEAARAASYLPVAATTYDWDDVASCLQQ